MNLTRPEKKLPTSETEGGSPNIYETNIRNKIIDEYEAYQNQQMEGLEELFNSPNWDVVFRHDKKMMKDLATKIREMMR